MVWGVILAAAIGERGKSAARKTARKNARGVYAETTENIRRTLLSQAQEFGVAKSSYGASGLSLESGSIKTYLKAMQDNFDKNIDWLKRARDLGVETEFQRGETAATAINANTATSVVNTLAAGDWGSTAKPATTNKN